MRTAIAADALDGDDVLVLQARGVTGLVLEALLAVRVHRGSERQHLERDAAAEGKLLVFINDALAAAADLADDSEIAEDIGLARESAVANAQIRSPSVFRGPRTSQVVAAHRPAFPLPLFAPALPGGFLRQNLRPVFPEELIGSGPHRSGEGGVR